MIEPTATGDGCPAQLNGKDDHQQRAVQKLGSERPSRENNRAPRSIPDPLLIAARVARGKEMITAIAMAHRVSSIVAGNLARMRSVTDDCS